MRPILGRLTNRSKCLCLHHDRSSRSNNHSETTSYIRASSSSCLFANYRRLYSTRLAEVGRFEEKYSDEECYKPGQTFLHRVFGYRGVALFPWFARVHDMDLYKQNSSKSARDRLYEGINKFNDKESQQHRFSSDMSHEASQDTEFSDIDANSSTEKERSDIDEDRDKKQQSSKKPKFTNPLMTRFHPYYQVLIDKRDCAFVSNRTQTEAVTFLGHPDNSKSVYSIKALDYVAHEDVLPYTSLEEPFIQHDLYKKLFQVDYEASLGQVKQYVPTSLLQGWRSKHPWLELSHVYRETTHDVRVTVIPFYLGNTTIEGTSFHWWRYCVRLENFGKVAVQLRERSWKIFSRTNMLQTIKGRGVVGVEPLLTQSEPAYQYSSHVNLQDESGRMWGTFKMQREDGQTFECKIPAFALESALDAH